jgi:hypothetical protein
MNTRRRERGQAASLLLCFLLSLGMLLGPANIAQAQETTGTIEGVVRDASGGVLPGATVEATGPVGVVTTVSNEQGEYRFPRLPSGRYSIRVSLPSFATGTSAVDLTVGTTARVEFELRVAGVTETVEVTAQPAAVDLSSASVGTNIARERIEFLPRGRDFTDLVAQAPGASNEMQAGGISVNGSSGSENRFVIDGIDTTSMQEGVNAMPLRAEFMEEVVVKSSGYAAEFGGSTGGVINAITKSGTNAWSGGFISDFQSRSWGGKERPLLRDSLTENTFVYVNPPKDKETRIDPSFFMSGPILRNRLWFFGSYMPGIRSTKRTVTFTNGVTNTFDQDLRVNYGTFNVTGNANSKLLFRGGGNFAPAVTERSLPGQDGRTSLTSPDQWLRGTELDRRTLSGSVDYIPSSRFTVSARMGRFFEDQASTAVDFFPRIHEISTASTPAGVAALPDEFRRPVGFRSDVLIGDATAKDKYVRDYVGADATYYFSGAGEHQIKGGFQTEFINNDVQSGYNADRILYYAGRPYTIPSTGQPVQGTFGYFRLLNISTQGETSSRNEAFFIQDTWRLGPRLTLNLGLRMEHERIPNFGTRGVKNPIEFNFGDKIAPRLGFTYDVDGTGRSKLYGSYGTYYDVMKYELPRGSFGGDKWVDYFYLWDSANWPSNSTTSCATGTNTASERPTCPAGRFIEALDRRHNSAEDPDSGIDPNLKPMQDREYQIGFERELNWHRFVVGARYIRRDLVRTIEDVGVLICDAPGSCGEVFYIANPGEGISLELANAPGIPNFPKAVRQYDGLELTFNRHFADRWQLGGSYTISRLYGNYSGLASSDENGRTSPNVNRFFDHIENSFDRTGQSVLGRLGTDRPHQFRTQLIYRFDWNLTMGITQRIASGIPISEEAFVSATVPFFPFGRGNLGRSQMVSETNLSLIQNFRIADYDLDLGVTILNLFDRDAVMRRYRNRTVSALPLSTQQFFAGGWDYDTVLAANPRIHDVKFNQPDQFMAPREVRLTVKFRF